MIYSRDGKIFLMFNQEPTWVFLRREKLGPMEDTLDGAVSPINQSLSTTSNIYFLKKSVSK